jgi:hypothetical protein
MEYESISRRMKVWDCWYKELGGKQLNYFLSTLENFKLSTPEISQEIYEGTFEKTTEHWEWPQQG